MKRGEIWWIDFNPSIAGEIQKKRPAIIVSNNSANKFLNRIQVVPLTSNIDHLYPCETYVVINKKKRKAMADQIATVSKKRLSKKMGNISMEDMCHVEQVIKIQLELL